MVYVLERSVTKILWMHLITEHLNTGARQNVNLVNYTPGETEAEEEDVTVQEVKKALKGMKKNRVCHK